MDIDDVIENQGNWLNVDEAVKELAQLRQAELELSDLKRHYAAVLRELADATGYVCKDDSALIGNFDPHEAIGQLTERYDNAKSSLLEMIDAMHKYEIDVDEIPPYNHIRMIERAWLAANSTHESDGKEVK